MLRFIANRIAILIPLLLLISLISFILIQLPPGDFLTTLIETLRASGTELADDEIARLTRQYGLDRPLHSQYLLWISNIILHGDLGWSFNWNRPVSEVIGARVWFTVVITMLSVLFIWVVSIPIGIYSATHQYSIGDYFFTFLGFIGIATPGFLLALLVVWTLCSQFGFNVSGLHSSEYLGAAWSWAKFVDLLAHLWVPMVLLGISGTGALIRIMRGTLLDELSKQYVITARAKGLKESRLLFKYPVRLAINPLISTIGWLLPFLFSGELLISLVLDIPTIGPVLLRALLFQDMYLAGSFIVILSALVVTGTLISDVLLAWIDPRIRFGQLSDT